ncbi:MAG TPA: hypothetical protein VIV40_37910 [Kofleriaceae bacterium]
MIVCAPLVAAAQPSGAGEVDMTKPDSPPAEPVPKPAPEPSGQVTPTPLVDKDVEAPKFAWQPFGYLRMQYIVVQNDPNVAFVGRDDGFELQNARVGVHGDLQHLVRFTISFDGAVDERAQNTPQGKLRVGLRDAFADVWVGGDLAVRGGYFQTWVDPQALVADTEREFVDKPIETRGMRSTEGWYTPGLPPGRSLGAALRLDPEEANHLGVEVAVQNGADEFASNNDNDKPAVSAAAMFRLADHGFVVAAGRWNPRTVGELPFRQDETDLQGSLGAQINAGAIAVGLGGIVQRTTFESTGGPAQNAYGAHAQLMFTLPGRPLSIGYRFGILDPSSLIVTDRVMEHTAGAVLGVSQFRMRVQLQLSHVQEQSARDLSNDRIQLAAEVAL